ncbi:MAG: Gldg family protein [Planctomycetota bacterium]|jgi:ABC-type uncharacterized transport system involved in gliding motility auxiliary subunit
MRVKRILFMANAAVVVVLLAAILVFANLILSDPGWKTRRDLTEEDLFTLDPLSREIPAKFDDVVTVRYYATPDKFPATAQYETLARDVEDKLMEYVANSDGKLRLKVIDPREGKKTIDKEVKEKLEAEGVTVSSDTDFEDDKPVPREFYSSIKLNYADKTQVIDGVQSVDNLEYRVTKALRSLQVKKVPKIGFFFSGKEEGFGREGQFQSIQRVLRDHFLVVPVHLGEKDPVPDDIDLLFVVVPDGVPPRHRFAIDQYLMNGRAVEIEKADRLLEPGEEGSREVERSPGRVVFLMEVFDQSRQVGQPRPGQIPLLSKIDSGLGDLLKHWGVQVNADMILDLDLCGYGDVPKTVFIPGVGAVERLERVQWPRMIRSKNENYAQAFAFVNPLDNIVFVDALSVAPVEPLPDGVTYEPIVRSSKRSWRIDFGTAPFIVPKNDKIPEKSVAHTHIDPEAHQAKANPEGAQYVLAGVWQGKFKSFFAGKPVPKPAKDPSKEGPEAEPEASPPVVVEKTTRTRALMKDDVVLKEKTIEDATSRVVVIGDGQVFSDFIFRYQHKPNIDFLVNLIEWLTTEESLSRIRSKGHKARPLKYDRSLKDLFIVLLVGSVPLLVPLIGGGVLVFRCADKVISIKALQRPSPPPGVIPEGGEAEAPAEAQPPADAAPEAGAPEAPAEEGTGGGGDEPAQEDS